VRAGRAHDDRDHGTADRKEAGQPTRQPAPPTPAPSLLEKRAACRCWLL